MHYASIQLSRLHILFEPVNLRRERAFPKLVLIAGVLLEPLRIEIMHMDPVLDQIFRYLFVPAAHKCHIVFITDLRLERAF